MLADTLKKSHIPLTRVGADERGQDLIEYALLVAFMVIAVWAFFPTQIVPSISNIFSRITSTASVLAP